MAITIRLAPDIEQRLNRLSVQTGRAKSYYLRELIEGAWMILAKVNKLTSTANPPITKG